MTLKTKDILKILKLVKKSKKAKKRRRKNKHKLNITTQQITPSTLQPYEISRQPINNSNSIQLDNIRLNNQLLENKLKEPDSNNIKAIEDKLNLAIGYNNLQDKLNLTTSSISDIKNDNMNLTNKLNRVIDFGENFVAETKRKFDNHQLKIEDTKKKMYNKQPKQKQKNAANLSAVFDDIDDDPFTNSNPLNNVETVAEETKTEPVNQPEQTALNTSNVSNIANTEDNFVYKKINNEKILRALLKKIETKPSRKLTEEEKNILKPFYTKYNVRWGSNTQTTGGVKKQLQNFSI
jgi:hypothetical protein